MNKSECLREYEDWVKLLKETKAEDLLKDPQSVWEEAWHVARVTYNPKAN